MEPQTQPLVCPSHATQYIGMIIVGVVVGAGASFVYFKQAPAGDTDRSYQAGYDDAKKRVLESALSGMIVTPDDIRTLVGPVTAIEGNRITLHTPSMNPFEDPALDSRIITITPETKILKLSAKDPLMFQAETDAFMKKMQEGKVLSQELTPPDIFTRTAATFADIVEGDNLNVFSAQNIKNSKDFSASEIQIQPKPTTITN